MINDKKGADRGVDGIVLITHDLDRKSKTVIFLPNRAVSMRPKSGICEA